MNVYRSSIFALGAFILPYPILWYGFSVLEPSGGQYKRQKGITEIAIADMCKDDYIAEQIAKSKYPITLAAIAKTESDCTPQAIGDHGDSKGLFQIQEKHFGKVPDKVEDQVLLAERILDDRFKKYGYIKGIERYNGSGKQARLYRDKVLAYKQILLDKTNKR